MNWLYRYRYPIGGSVVAIVGVGAALVYTGLSGPSGTPSRSLLLQFDSRTPEYLKQHAAGWMTKPAAATNYLHCPMSDLSSYGGGATCIDQSSSYVLLAQRDTNSLFQMHTPIPAKGQGRKGWYFNGSSSSAGSYIRATSTSTVSFGTVTALAVEVLAAPILSTGTSQVLATTQDAGSTTSKGVSLFTSGDTSITCQINGNGSSVQFGYADFVPDAKVHHFLCVKTYSGGAWTTAIYIDGKSKTVAESGSSNSNDISSGVEFTVGANNGSTLYPTKGYIYEVKLSNVSRDSSYAAAAYRQSIYNGTYWSADANTIFLAKFDEKNLASGLLDYSGGSKHLTVQGGTPWVRSGQLPYPMGDGFTRKAIFMGNGSLTYNYFQDSGTSYGDVTTNDFSVSFWIAPRSNPSGSAGSEDRIASKVVAPLAITGWDIYRNTTDGGLNILIGNGSSYASGKVASLEQIPNNVWSFVTVNFDRSGNANAMVNGASAGFDVGISVLGSTLTNSAHLTIGNYSYGTSSGYNFDGNMAEFMFSDGLTTLAEHQAMYKAFRAPTNISSEVSLSRTTHNKYQINEDDFGTRLGVYGGSSTTPQWPVMYGVKLKSTRTNLLGYVNEFNSWSKSSTTIVDNTAVGPRGAQTASRATQSSGGYISKQALPTGTVASGETWCSSVYLKRVSGSCDRFYLAVDNGTGYTITGSAYNSAWNRYSYCGGQVSATRTMVICGTTAGSGAGCATDCVYDLAEAQYEKDQVTDLCTDTTGNVVQTCDDGSNTLGLGFPAWQQTVNYIGYANEFDNWSSSGSPTITANAAEAPDGSVTADRITYSVNNQQVYKTLVGGGTIVAGEQWVASGFYKRISGSCTGVRLACDSSGTDYTSLTDSTVWTRISCSTRNTGTTKQANWWAATHGSCVIDVADAQYEAENLTPSCTSTEGNVSQTCNVNYLGIAGNLVSMPYSMERGEVVTSAALGPMVHNPAVARRLWRLGDGGEYLDEGIQPVFQIRDLGGFIDGIIKGKPIGSGIEKRTYVTSWDYRDGIPNTDVDRYSWKFERASSENVAASSTSVADPSSATALSVEVLVKHNTNVDYEVLVDNSNAGNLTGYSLLTGASSNLSCYLKATNLRYCYTGNGYLSTPGVHQIVCTWDKTGSDWNDPKIYIDGNQVGTACSGSTATGNISNGQALSIGGVSTYYSDTNIYEVRILTKALSADEVKKDWLASRGTGTAWAKTSSDLAHYNFMESATTSGLLDISGNGNNLTVVGGSPVARSTQWPYPDGGSKRYASMTVNGSYAKSLLQPRALSASIPSTPWNRRHPNAPYAIFGCATTSDQCLNGVIENFEWWSRPSSKSGIPDDTSHLLTADFSGASFLSNNSLGGFTTPSGATASKTWIWNLNDWGSPIADWNNEVELTGSGTIRYWLETGLISRGQGRKGIFFTDDDGDVDRFKATSTSIASLDEVSGFTLEAIVHNTQRTDNGVIFSSRGVAGGSGIGFGWGNSEDKIMCNVSDGTNARNYAVDSAMGTSYGPAHYACVGTYSGSDWTFVIYKNGEVLAGTLSGTATTNRIAHAQPLAVGAISDYTTDYGFSGYMYEAMISNTARTATVIKNHYKQSIRQGTFWTDDSNTIAHYYFNDIVPINGIGLTDYSGNSNHLTVKTGTPKGYDQHNGNAPWPMGSGFSRQGIWFSGASSGFSGGSSTGVPSDSQPFSIAVWYRGEPFSGGTNLVQKGTSSQYWQLVTTGGTSPSYAKFYWGTSSGGSNVTTATGVTDTAWHLIAAKATWVTDHWHIWTSVDGEAFADGGDAGTGSVSSNSNNILIGPDASLTMPVDLAGVMILKDYELTDADVAAMAAPTKSADPTGGLLTYSRAASSTAFATCFEVYNKADFANSATSSSEFNNTGVHVACFPTGAIPYMWSSVMQSSGYSMPGNRGFDVGTPVFTTITNEMNHSDRQDQWLYSGMTGYATANAARSYTGRYTADRHTANTSSSQHYFYSQLQPDPALNDYIVASGYFKYESQRYICLAVYSSSVSAQAHVVIDLTVPEATAVGVSGSAYSTPDIDNDVEVYGVTYGWIAARLRTKCVDSRGCTNSLIRVYFTDSSSTCASTYTSAGEQLYSGGMQMVFGTKYQYFMPHVLCYTQDNAASSCYGPTSIYVDSSKMTGWNKAQGVIAAHSIAGKSALFPMLFNGGDNDGQVNMYMNYNNNLTIYDYAGTESQQIYGSTSVNNVYRSGTFVWDSALEFDGARQAYSFSNASSYAGKASTWATDVGNWTSTGGDTATTDFILGNYTGWEMEGIVGGASIYTKR